LRLEQQRLALGARQRHFDARDLRHHGGDARIHARLEEIAADALFQVAGLADIEDVAAGAQHAVHAGRAAQGAHESLAVEGAAGVCVFAGQADRVLVGPGRRARRLAVAALAAGTRF
jgi:hypothetical protein